MRIALALMGLLLVANSSACEIGGRGPACGPSEAVVKRVIDGDTVELEDGQRVRFLLIDTPESTQGKDDCFGQESSNFNRELLEGKTIQLSYDRECTDSYDRLLAYIELEGRDVNALFLERGLACVLHIPPNGRERIQEYRDLESAARQGQVGLWGACEEVTCD